MNRVNCALWSTILAAFLGCPVADAAINVYLTRQGNPVPEPYQVTGPDVMIPSDLGMSVTLDGVTMIRIVSMDSTTQALQDLGHVTVTAVRSTEDPLLVMVASQTFFPFDPTAFIGNGAVNWNGGLSCSAECESAVSLAAGVSGSISGHVQSGQIFRLQSGGAISADVIASNPDSAPQSGIALAVMSASSISGDVQATIGTIGDIISASTSQGITGDILAPAGEIRSILSGWEIGQQSPATPVRIEAKTGIGSIVAKAINADIKADVNNGTGSLRLLRTETFNTGHLRGSLRAKGLLADGALAGGIEVRGSQFAPIEISGSVNRPIRIENASLAPITVDGDVLRDSKISARRFTHPIMISGTLSTSIEANGVGATEIGIAELEVANISVPPRLSQSDAPVVVISSTSGTASRRIGSIRVGGTIAPNSTGQSAHIRCSQIESIEVGVDSLSGDAMFTLAASANPLARDETIGRPNVNPTRVVTLKVKGSLTGLLHISSFDHFECEDFAGTLYLSDPYGPPPSGQFPGARMLIGRTNVGHIVFDSDTSVREHVIFNRGAEQGGDLGGTISLEHPSMNPVPLELSSSGVLAEPASMIGGGSIALWPYRLYPADCFPSGLLLGGAQTDLTVSDFTAETADVHVRFTGPIKLDASALSGEQNPVRLDFIRYVNGFPFNIRIDDSKFDATIPTSSSVGSNREILISADDSYIFAPGLYRVTPNPDLTNPPILCTGTVDANGDPVSLPLPAFEYFFSLADDYVDGGDCSVGDYDGNGGVDGGDLAAFFIDFEAGEPDADVDGNGGVDGGDIATFFHWFELGGC